ncbi:MAG TPA: metallophosphoesterase [Verrucomicrobiae bacterium]|nr:metallophosphoesterase [Verrucomicrobiae bacterium]
MGEPEKKAAKNGRSWWRRNIVVLVILAILVALAFDAFLVEPANLQVTRYTIHANIRETLKIADLSDLHTRGMNVPERKLLAILAAEKPDAILITGDTLADPFGNYEDALQVYKKLAALHAPLGVWFVRGNWENLRPLRHEREFYREAGIHLLVNQNTELAPGVWLIGLDDPYTGRVNLNQALHDIPASAYKIAMFHAPFFFPRIAGDVNLVLAGHTHGGQIRIPFVKPFWLPAGCGPYLAGWYDDGNARMYVNRGIGMSEVPARFLCRPEVSIIMLEH